MAGLRQEPPSQEEGLRIVQRMIEGDPTASSDFAEAYLGVIARSLALVHPEADGSEIQTAAEDAIWSCIQRPQQYDPGRLTLVSYLGMAARQDLANLRRTQYRHWSRQADWGHQDEDVELPHLIENIQGSELDDPARIAELNETIAEMMHDRNERLAAVSGDLSPEETEGLLLVMDGERKTEVFVQTLGWGHLSVDDQRSEVKRFKDRMQKRLDRSGVGNA